MSAVIQILLFEFILGKPFSFHLLTSFHPYSIDLIISKNRLDVTDDCAQTCHIVTCPLTCIALIPGILGKKTITLEKNKAVYNYEGYLYSGQSTTPYGELGSVEAFMCCGFHGFMARSLLQIPILPGNCCNKEYVKTVVDALNERQQQRGDQAMLERSDALVMEMASLRRDVSAIMDHLKVARPLDIPGVHPIAPDSFEINR